MNKNDFRKSLRNMDYKKIKETLLELETEKSFFMGKIERASGLLKDQTMNIRKIKWQIACLKTIARERGLRL